MLQPESFLIEPFGGKLMDLTVHDHEVEELMEHAKKLPSLQISERFQCDLELLATGAFSPLDRFMAENDFERVLEEMRLQNGVLFPIPITLPVSEGDLVKLDAEITLRSPKNEILAIMRVEEIYTWDRVRYAQKVFGTLDTRHPLVAEIERWEDLQISGPLQVLQLPIHHDFKSLRLKPSEARSRIESMGKANIIAFQTRNPLHRVHEELTKRAMQELDGVLLLHPVVGLTSPGDIDHFTRVRTYQALVDRYFDSDRVLLALLPLAMRLAGPKEALWHAIIRRNYGANHLIVGRDHAGPGRNSAGEPFYQPYEAQDLVDQLSDEIGVRAIPFKEFIYMVEEERFEERTRIPQGAETASVSGTEVREDYLNAGKPLPEWFTRPEVAEILAETYPPRHRQGVCVWFTGLSGAGKSTTAEVLTVLLQEAGRQVTLLDGDIIRTNLSTGLGFSKEDRDTNIRRIGFVASELVRHGGTVIVAAVSPYRSTRNDVRNMVGIEHYLEVFVDTPLEICEQRDSKGLYAKARRGEIKGFTGIDDPYEAPENAEIRLDTLASSPEDNGLKIVDYLRQKGFVRRSSEPEA